MPREPRVPTLSSSPVWQQSHNHIAITLTARGALSADDVDVLGRLPGASARLRRGLRRALATRSDSGAAIGEHGG